MTSKRKNTISNEISKLKLVENGPFILEINDNHTLVEIYWVRGGLLVATLDLASYLQRKYNHDNEVDPLENNACHYYLKWINNYRPWF